MKRSTTATIGLVVAGLLGLSDVAGPALTDGQHPPMSIAIAGAVLGLITLAGVVMGWRGSRPGIVAVIVTRLLSALSAVPAFFVDGVPAGAKAAAAVGIVLTLLSVALVAPMLRDRAGSPATVR
jgi:hypothetical protein